MRKPLVEESPCINLYADLWRKPIDSAAWASGTVEWRDAAGEVLEVASFELSAVGSDGERILGILRGVHLQPIRIGPAKRGYASTFAAWCPDCDRRAWKLYPEHGKGRFVCKRCSSLEYASNHRRNRHADVDRCVKDPAAYLAERAAMQRPSLQTHLVTMRTYQRARQRIIDGR